MSATDGEGVAAYVTPSGRFRIGDGADEWLDTDTPVDLGVNR